MIKSEKFTTTCNFNKAGFDVYDYIKCRIRNDEYSKAKESKTYSEGCETLEKAYPGADVLLIPEEDCFKALAGKTDAFLKARSEVSDLKKEVESCIPLSDITALSERDQAFLQVLCFPIYGVEVIAEKWFEESTFTDDNGVFVDLLAIVEKYFKKGQKMADAKNGIRGAMNKLFGTESDNFYGLSVRKSDISDETMKHFFASFSKGKTLESGQRVYYTRQDKTALIKNFTEFCSVIFTDNKRHEVKKPDEKSTPEATK